MVSSLLDHLHKVGFTTSHLADKVRANITAVIITASKAVLHMDSSKEQATVTNSSNNHMVEAILGSNSTKGKDHLHLGGERFAFR
jgi:hypothetical protein